MIPPNAMPGWIRNNLVTLVADLVRQGRHDQADRLARRFGGVSLAALAAACRRQLARREREES